MIRAFPLRDMEWDMPVLGITGMCSVGWAPKEPMALNGMICGAMISVRPHGRACIHMMALRSIRSKQRTPVSDGFRGWWDWRMRSTSLQGSIWPAAPTMMVRPLDSTICGVAARDLSPIDWSRT